MKRSAKWFLSEFRKQVKEYPRLPVRFDIDIKREGKAANDAREELQRTPGQWTVTYGAYPNKRNPGMLRVAFIGPDRPQPIKIIRIPAVRADKQAVAGHLAELSQSRFYPKNTKAKDAPSHWPTAPSDMLDLLPHEARAMAWAEQEAKQAIRDKYQREYGPELYVELCEPRTDHIASPSMAIKARPEMGWLRKFLEKHSLEEFENICSTKTSPGGRTWSIRLWRGEDWLTIQYPQLFPAEIAYALEQGEWAGSALATIEPLARNKTAQIERNRLNAPLAGRKRASCTYAEINAEFAAYKKRNPNHSYAAAEIKVADALKYSNHRKLGERIKRLTKTTPAKWYRSLK